MALPVSFGMTSKTPSSLHVYLLALVVSLFLLGCERPAPPTSSVKLKGALEADFTLQDPDGNKVSLSDFKGKAVLLFFGFVHCPDVCPTALGRAAMVKQLLEKDAHRLQVIFVSLDPARDTPQILREYTAAFGSDFLGLTSDEKTVEDTAKAFGIVYKKVPTQQSYTIDHSTISYLFAPSGKADAIIKAEAPAEEVARDVRRVLK